MRKYATAYSLALQETLQRRSSLAMERVGSLALLLSLYFFWRALLAGKSSFLGYSQEQMLTYVLGLNLVRAFALTGRGWELVGQISSGKISAHLVKPFSFAGYALSLDLAQKTVGFSSALIEVGILVLLIGAPVYAPRGVLPWLSTGLAVLLSSLLFFLLEFMVGTMAFWTSESGGPLFCFELFLQFAAGSFFPLDVLPHAVRSALNWTPFPYLAFLPISIYLGRISSSEALRVILIQAAWLSALWLLAAAFWRKGVQSYGAEGG